MGAVESQANGGAAPSDKLVPAHGAPASAASASGSGSAAVAVAAAANEQMSGDEEQKAFDVAGLERMFNAVVTSADSGTATSARVLVGCLKSIGGCFDGLRVMWENVSKMLADIGAARAHNFIAIIGQYEHVLDRSDHIVKSILANAGLRAYEIRKLRIALRVMAAGNKQHGAAAAAVGAAAVAAPVPTAAEKAEARKIIAGLDFKTQFEEAEITAVLTAITKLLELVKSEIDAIGQDKARAVTKRNWCIVAACLAFLGLAVCIAVPFVAPLFAGAAGAAAATSAAAVTAISAVEGVSGLVMAVAATGAVMAGAAGTVATVAAVRLDSVKDKLEALRDMYVGAEQRILALQSDWKSFGNSVTSLKAMVTKLDEGKATDLQMSLLIDENVAKADDTERENDALIAAAKALGVTVAADQTYYKSLLDLRRQLLVKTF